MRWLVCAIPDEAQAKVLEDRLRRIGPVIFTRDENGNVKNGHHDLANIMFVDHADIRSIDAALVQLIPYKPLPWAPVIRQCGGPDLG
jgi:hypothetical protein